MANKKCPVCKKQYPDLPSVSLHIEKNHSDKLPNGWSGAKYMFFSNHGRSTGQCRICKMETEFNEVTGRPEILCKSERCRKVFRENFKNNMKKVYGKETLLNDPEVQRKMLANRSLAKQYEWSDGAFKTCIGSYEYDFAQFLDVFMNFPSNDIFFPAPMTLEYDFDGKTHFYIPDVYIGSLNLIVEIKDGGSNVNTHPKIQAVDKKKEKAKEDAIRKQTKYNYVKVTNKDYGIFVETLIKLKEQEKVGNESQKFIPVILIKEYTEILSENIIKEMEENRRHNGAVVSFYDKSSTVLQKGIKLDNKIYSYINENISEYEEDDYEVVDIDDEFDLDDEEFEDIILECYENNIMTNLLNEDFPNYLLDEKALSSKQRNKLKDNDFGIPEERKYPLTDKNHVLQAIRYFNKCEKKYEKQLADNIIQKINKFKLDVNVSNDNRFSNYYKGKINESVENVDMSDIHMRFDRDVKEFNLYDPTTKEKEILRLVCSANTIDELEVAESFLVIIHDQMKHTLINTLVELKRIMITVENQ